MPGEMVTFHQLSLLVVDKHSLHNSVWNSLQGSSKLVGLVSETCRAHDLCFKFQVATNIFLAYNSLSFRNSSVSTIVVVQFKLFSNELIFLDVFCFNSLSSPLKKCLFFFFF